jgi:putative intracellular protease/amidase/quinol monooxygenase YgiN
MPNVLFVTTSYGKLGDTGRATGVWLEELAVPYCMFLDVGHEVTIASVRGGRMPVDQRSSKTTGAPPAVQRFLGDARAMAAIEATPAIEAIRAGDYDAIFLPGGHGAMWDLPGSEALALALGEAFDERRVIAALCHGVAGLVSARRRDGRPIVAGGLVAGFTNAEEEAEALAAIVPFLLETRLRELGARFERGPNFESFAIRDGNLITGQNPASSADVARLVLQALDEKPRTSNPVSTQQKQEIPMSSSESLTRRDALVAGTAAGAVLAATGASASAADRPPAVAAPPNARAVMVTLRLSAKNADAFKQHLLKVIPVTRLASGCRYSHSYQHTKTPSEFLLVQGWDSLEQQQGYIAWRQARGDLAQFGAFLGSDPVIETFDLFDA